MRVLIISKEGDGTGIADRLAQEGHGVDLWIKEPRFKMAMRGIVNRVDSWRPHVAGADLVIFDMVGYGHLKELFGKMGKPVLCCHPFGDMIELDRMKGDELCGMAGIKTPESQYYNSPEEARAVLSAWEDGEEGYVLKPCGNAGTDLTQMCRTPEVFEWALSRYDAKQKLVVQEIEEGVEVSTEGWFNGSEFVAFNHTFEEKKLMNENIGPTIGCAGNVVMALKEPNRLVQQTVMKLAPALKRVGYRGPVDINCIVDEECAMALEFTARFGYDAIEAMMTGMRGDVGKWLFDVALGVARDLDITMDYMMAVRVTKAPYPDEIDEDEVEELRGMPIQFPAEARKYVYVTDAYKNGTLKFAASDGVVCKVTSTGRDINEATRRAYRTIDNLYFPGAQYRTDIGKRVPSDLAKLKEWGWL